MGVILYCMVLGYLPFEDPQHIVDADFIPFEDSDHLSFGMFPLSNGHSTRLRAEQVFLPLSEFQDLISRIFRFDPTERITIQKIREHPWTNKVSPRLTTRTNSSSLSLENERKQGMPPLEPPREENPVATAQQEEQVLLKKLEEFGFDKNDILKSLSQEDFNQITASFFLLQQQHLHSEPHSPNVGGGGCPFAHAHKNQEDTSKEEKHHKKKDKHIKLKESKPKNEH